MKQIKQLSLPKIKGVKQIKMPKASLRGVSLPKLPRIFGKKT